jgi:hypothetical protein
VRRLLVVAFAVVLAVLAAAWFFNLDFGASTDFYAGLAVGMGTCILFAMGVPTAMDKDRSSER